MTIAVLALGGVGLLVAWPHRPPPDRVAGLAPVAPMAVLTRRRVGLFGFALAGMLISPAVPVLALVALRAGPSIQRRREAGRRRWAVVSALPEAADLLALSVAGGLTVPLAMAAASRWSPDPVGEALRQSTRRVRLGASTADVLDDLAADLGEPVRPLVAALLASERYGVALGDSLDRVAREARLERRRRGEERARRVPVLLLFPLVLCVLPAFGFLTVVPLLVGSLPDLPR